MLAGYRSSLALILLLSLDHVLTILIFLHITHIVLLLLLPLLLTSLSLLRTATRSLGRLTINCLALAFLRSCLNWWKPSLLPGFLSLGFLLVDLNEQQLSVSHGYEHSRETALPLPGML